MRTSRVVNGRTRDLRGNLNGVYDLYSSRIVKVQRGYNLASSYRIRGSRNVSCQCNTKKYLMCTCKNLPQTPGSAYFSFPKQVYRYSDWRSFTDIGVGSIKALTRKRIRKIYLPETIDKAVGSSDLISYTDRRSRQHWAGSYYDNKRTSSKCVGGFVDIDNVCFVNKKLSPIIQKKSGTTSPKHEFISEENQNIGSYNIHNSITMPTQVDVQDLIPKLQSKEQTDSSKIKDPQTSKHIIETDTSIPKDKLPTVSNKMKSAADRNHMETFKDFSSDSFVQHVHNLENPSEDKQSKTSIDPMENKIEREYRKLFASNSKDKPSIDKPIPDFKSASLLRRRFEALRRGLSKKDSKKDSILINKIPSHVSAPNRKDVSIASDPPSLVERSYSNTKVYSPIPPTNIDYKVEPKVSDRTSSKNDRNKTNPTVPKNQIQWSTDVVNNKYEGVQGMFKLWNKKFELEEESPKNSPKNVTGNISKHEVKIPEKELKPENPSQEPVPKKKQGRKFFLFGKKNKDNENQNKPFKPKKGFTAGRCEVKDGLMIKVGVKENSINEPVKTLGKHHEEYEGIFHKAWLDKYITNVGDSRNNVHIRWNNNMYAASSSTVLELMDSVYKHTGIDFRSRSEITTGESSSYRSYTKQRVHFMHQDLETWMIPKMIIDKQKQPTIEARYTRGQHTKNIPLKISDQKWFMDASNGFSKKIELVLHAKPHSTSSEYIIINIPEGYFSQSSSMEIQTQSSDEKIYKIIEYETTDLKKNKENRQLANGDNVTNNLLVSAQNYENKQDDKSKISEVIKNPPMLRDVAIQGSNVFFPKRCDVISVGIITQRDIRDPRKPILTIDDELSDVESEEKLIRHTTPKKCELAESYLQDYCRNWMPSGIDLYSWRVSGSQLLSSENNSLASLSLSQGEVTKSCPNMYDDFQEPTIIMSSCETSSCSHCIALEDERRQDDSLKCKIMKKFKMKATSEVPFRLNRRQIPKDSLEVLKKRQFYACTNQRAKWGNEVSEESEPCSTPSIEDLKASKPCWRMPDQHKRKKKGKNKHVSFPGCKAMSKLTDQLSNRSVEGILTFKGSGCSHKDLQPPKRVEIAPKRAEVPAKRAELPAKRPEVPAKPQQPYVCEIPLPLCKDSCDQEKKPACTMRSGEPCDELYQKFVNPEAFPPCDLPPVFVLPKHLMPSESPPVCIKPRKTSRKTSCEIVPNVQHTSDENLQTSKKTSCDSGMHCRTSLKSSPTNSGSFLKTLLRKGSKKKYKDCGPSCVYNKNTSPRSSPPPTDYCRPAEYCRQPEYCTQPEYCSPQTPPPDKQKMSGLYLKKLPSQKNTSCGDILHSNLDDLKIRLNSQERILIRMKKETPSTEEIREGLNIKVQDEDGQTLFERIDYKQRSDVNKCILLKDMFNESLIQRASTPPTTTILDATETKSKNEMQESKNEIQECQNDSSVDNLIEINLTLKLKQGDKSTRVDIKNAGDCEIKQTNENQMTQCQNDLDIVQDREGYVQPINENKKDVNINIIIKNYKTDADKTNEIETDPIPKTCDNNFSKMISEQFQTISTGNSDHHELSIHRTSVDLTTSTDFCSNLVASTCRCVLSDQLIDDVPNKVETSRNETVHSVAEKTVNSIKYDDKREKSIPSEKNSFTNNAEHSTELSLEETDDFDDYSTERYSSQKENNRLADMINKTSTEGIRKKFKLHNKTQKKEMLKKLFRSSSIIKKPENKKKIKEIIRVILTSDSSENEDFAVTNNELAKELTFASLDLNYFRDTDSMNNFYQLDSDLSNDESRAIKLNPTKNNSECSETDSYVRFKNNKMQGCLCSTVAAKLNLTKNGTSIGGCCCRKAIQKDEEINCDIRTGDYFININTCVDVETQNSNHISNEIKSTNLSIESKTQSVVITNTSVTMEKSIDNVHAGNKSKCLKTSRLNMGDIKSRGIKRSDRDGILGPTDDEMYVVNSNLVEQSVSQCYRKKVHKNNKLYIPADMLQLNETKKAVLEIYAEKIISDEGETIVAKLPKFDLEKEVDIKNYQDIVSGHRRISRRNFVMMSLNRQIS